MGFDYSKLPSPTELVDKRIQSIALVRTSMRGAKLYIIRFLSSTFHQDRYAEVWVPKWESVFSLGEIRATEWAAQKMRAAIDARNDDLEPCRDLKGKFQGCI